MTPAEVAATLRQFNGWRRDFEDKLEQPDSREIGEAIDAAIAMIDRLESSESDALEQARLNGMGASREAALLAKLEAAEKELDALRAKIEQMERQEPFDADSLVAAARRVLASADSQGLIRLDESGDVASDLRSALEAAPEAKP